MAEEKVTDDQLDAAAEEVSDEVEPEVEVDEVEPEVDEKEKEDHRLQSALGRIGSMQAKIDKLENMISNMDTEKPEEVDDDEIVTSKQDVLRIFQEKEQMEKNKRAQYTETAVNTLIDLGLQNSDLTDDTYVTIHKDAEANWKSKTGDPKLDAEINFTEALNRHYQKMITKNAEPTNPLNKNKDADGQELGGAAETSVKTKNESVPKLDDSAKDFIERVGMKPESINKALKGDMPMYLRGGKF